MKEEPAMQNARNGTQPAKPREMDEVWLKRLCKDNELALQFMRIWHRWVHMIDDLVDGELNKDTWREQVIQTFAVGILTLSHPFYQRNVDALRLAAVMIANTYADTVQWEKSDKEWQRQWADHHRHCAAQMALAVAALVGGFEHMRTISGELNEICYELHHDESGKPT